MTLLDKAEALRIVMEECYKDREMKLATRIEERIAALPARGVGVDVEDAARAIYDAMRFERKDKTPEWVKGGNSNAQVEARSTAARILAALAPTDAAQAREAAMQELIDAYEDIMDYGIVFAKKPQQHRLNAAKEKLKEART